MSEEQAITTLEDLEGEALDTAIVAWIADPRNPAPSARQLADWAYSGDDDYPHETLAGIAVDRSVALAAIAQDAENIALDATRAAAYNAIEDLVRQRNNAEKQANAMLGILYQIAQALLCAPDTQAVLDAIMGLQDKVRELDGENEDAFEKIRVLEKENEELHGEVDSLNDQLTTANEALEAIEENSYRGEDA